jgi:hypothetical protein
VAEDIFNGNDYFLDINNYKNAAGQIITDSFEFKLINAFRQLGFSRLTFTWSPDQLEVSVTLNRFREIYGLEESDYLDKATLILIDGELERRERLDRIKADEYPPFVKFINAPSNEPPMEHYAMLLNNFFSSMPESTTTNGQGEENVWSVEQFRSSVSFGLSSNLGVLLDETGTRELTVQETVEMWQNNETNFIFCPNVYYTSFNENYSTFNGDYENPSTLINRYQDDFTYMALIAHEYGHGVSYGTYLNLDGLGDYPACYLFGEISFVMDPSNIYASSINKIRPDNNNEFISGYSKVNNKEDFADHFSAYILEGRIFRERASENVFLQEKYDFLKTHIFAGKEFDTGDLYSYHLWESDNTGLPWHPEDYHIQNRLWFWDYE